jgi:hypothetical protein
MPFPIEFAIPPGWQAPNPGEEVSPLGTVVAVRPEPGAVIVADGGFRPDEASLPEIAEETVTALRAAGVGVDVLRREALGSSEAPGFAQILVTQDDRETVQCQAFLAVLDVEDNTKRVVLRLALTTPKEYVSALVGDFQRFLGTVAPVTSETDYAREDKETP